MVLLLIILTIALAIGIESIIKWGSKPKQEMFYNPKVGFTMADGGKKKE
jgi:hypothetical protein